MLFQTDNEFIEELNNRKETESVDIQNKSHKVNENISNKKNLMHNGQKCPLSQDKDYVECGALGSNEFLKRVKL